MAEQLLLEKLTTNTILHSNQFFILILLVLMNPLIISLHFEHPKSLMINQNPFRASSKPNVSFQGQPKPSTKAVKPSQFQDLYIENRSELPDLKAQFENRLYKMYQVPASFHKAHIHQQAYKFGINTISTQADSQVTRCECCDHFIAYEELSLCHSVEIKKKSENTSSQNGKKRLQLPLGVSMYFSFIKMVIIYLTMRFIVFDLYNLYISMYGDYCSDIMKKQTTDLCTMPFSGYNLKSNHHIQGEQVLDLLNFAFTILSIVYFISFKQFQEEQKNESRLQNVSEDDFSIMLENIPVIIYNKYDEITDTNCDHQLQLRRHLQRKIRYWLQTFDENPANMRNLQKQLNQLRKQYHQDGKDLTIFVKEIVKSITICYDLTQMENINKLRQTLIEEIEKVNEDEFEEYSKLLKEDDGPYTRQLKETTMVQYLPNQIRMINEQYIKLCESFLQYGGSEIESTQFKLSHFTGKAIVTFQYQHFRDYFIRSYEQNPDFFQINGTSVSIRRASKPSDIYWFNMKITDEERLTYSRYSWGVLLMLLIISFSAFVGLQLLQSIDIFKTSSGNVTGMQLLKRYAVTASTGLLATGINFLLGYVINLLAQMEKHKTKSDRLGSLIYKTIVTQTINSSFIYLILYFIKPINPLGEYGLVNKVISVVIVSGFATLAMQSLRPVQIWNKLWNDHKQVQQKGHKSLKTVQIRLNKEFEHPKFGIAENYAFYIMITFTISFYGFLVPLATPIAIVIFFLEYWVDKYNLFRRSAPIDFGFVLGKQIFTVFEVSLFLFTFGYFMWDLWIHYDNGFKFKLINIASLLISAQYAGFYLAVPQAIKNKIVESNESLDPQSYNDYQDRNMFNTTFYSQNPATAFLKSEKISTKAPQTLLKALQKGGQTIDIKSLDKKPPLPPATFKRP